MSYFVWSDSVSILQVIAMDDKIQADFNPNVVAYYRLINYEMRDVVDGCCCTTAWISRTIPSMQVRLVLDTAPPPPTRITRAVRLCGTTHIFFRKSRLISNNSRTLPTA